MFGSSSSVRSARSPRTLRGRAPDWAVDQFGLLTGLLEKKQEHVDHQKRKFPLSVRERQATEAPAPRPFASCLRRRQAEGWPGLICELKRARPRHSGVERLREDYDPPQLACAYERGGAACLSVLTDTEFFEGNDKHLIQARAACSLPVLRKDILLEPYQIVESRALGADAILLILSVLGTNQASDLSGLALEYGMGVLLEVHDEEQLERALQVPQSGDPRAIIGINNRNLRTLELSLAVSERLAPLIPPGYLSISASGLSDRADLERLARLGISCFLVGSSLMKQADVEKATRDLLGSAGG